MIRVELPYLPTRTVRGTITDDGQILSLLFDAANVISDGADTTACPVSRQLDLEIPCSGSGSALVRLEMSGARSNAGLHSWNHAFILVNGKRLPVPAAVGTNANGGENWYGALTLAVHARCALRVSISLLAQRDLADNSSTAQIGLDSIDLQVIKQKQ